MENVYEKKDMKMDQKDQDYTPSTEGDESPEKKRKRRKSSAVSRIHTAAFMFCNSRIYILAVCELVSFYVISKTAISIFDHVT